MPEHTFLLEEGLWSVEGRLLLPGQPGAPFAGETRVSHEPWVWRLDGYLQVQPAGMRLENHYEIRPFMGHEPTMDWTSQNPVLGRLRGHFALVEDALISVFEAEGRELRGTEVLLRQDAGAYLSRGALLEGGTLVSSWVATLRRAT